MSNYNEQAVALAGNASSTDSCSLASVQPLLVLLIGLLIVLLVLMIFLFRRMRQMHNYMLLLQTQTNKQNKDVMEMLVALEKANRRAVSRGD